MNCSSKHYAIAVVLYRASAACKVTRNIVNYCHFPWIARVRTRLKSCGGAYSQTVCELSVGELRQSIRFSNGRLTVASELCRDYGCVVRDTLLQKRKQKCITRLQRKHNISVKYTRRLWNGNTSVTPLPLTSYFHD